MNKLCLLFLFVIVLPCVSGLVSKGTVKSKKNWVFIDKFCFDERGGEVTLAAINKNPDSSKNTIIAMYADAEDVWGEVVNSDKSCAYKVSKANHGEYIEDVNLGRTLGVKGSRPRWWYLVAANCVDDEEINFTYDFTFTNNGGFWSYHFSADAQGVFQMVVAFYIVQMLLVFAFIVIIIICIKRKMHSKILFVILASLTLEVINMMFQLIHYCIFARNGVGVPGLKDAGNFFEMMSHIVFYGLIFLLVRGWPISTNFIYAKRLIALVLVGFLVAYIALFIWFEERRDPASTLYMYDSVPGYIIITMRLLALGWSMHELIKTYKFENDGIKKAFYVILGVFMTLWFINLPVTVLIAHFVQAWVRETAVIATVLTIHTLTFFILAFLFRPSSGNKYFSVLDPNAKVEFGSNKSQIFPL
eukprot:TRINITY_DN180_c0_g1_i1.p1 TRINITY_DN180_c0_g1~~TRINITY_DN180_c0_g1_i1.p1  ORF type:complete len:416 (-),score=80.09 TRINITY_DN180_c0_g1_i1:28-1275(-)